MTTHRVSLVTPPGTLQVKPGDTIRMAAEFDYIGPACPDAKVRFYFYSEVVLGIVNEKAFSEKAFVLPQSSAPGSHVYLPPIGVNMDLVLPTSGLPAGLLYGLGVKVFNVEGKEYIFQLGKSNPPYYQWVVEVTGVISEISNLRIASYVKV